MYIKKLSLIFLAAICFNFSSEAHAAFTLKDGWFVSSEKVATMTPEMHYNIGVEAFCEKDWYEAVLQFQIVTLNFPKCSLAQDAHFYLGASYFAIREFDFANDAFTAYLKSTSTPKYFEEAIRYKYEIANNFRCGAKKRMFGTKRLPKWAPAYALAVEILDEVIAAMPCHDLAAQALYLKAYMLWEDRDYRDSIDVFSQLIRRFPKHELAPESYLAITNIYLEQSQFEFQNPDLLCLAEITVRRFQVEFPGDPKLLQAEYNLQTIKETYAYGLFATGMFYERKEHPVASVIYYQRAIILFPDTRVAQLCYGRLNALSSCCDIPPLPKREPELAPNVNT